ncbi:carboxymuconolactone decarboxylase family protein [Chitinophagaceae bacterium LB-8]|uniref:Carboxymuconolactone decarboxylase family protein n=1 Tax=Paraflavisolibacter caeni TaxID=2982496 RepID=A0A9X2XTS4_9BACT|nr:carboxymuconolactone decarboxylase family protein [Paraflavisolibacter caeni]MCU7548251.1 carboxymuconolactone decarboxylase family protein [Paraflavisolibacter caeni]
MEQRLNIQEVEPAAYRAMFGLEKYLQDTQLTKTHKELIKIRASQINGCAFCINIHTRDALKNGETAQRIFLLNAWRETDLFTEEERVILALTEEITLIHQTGLSGRIYEKAEKIFDKNYLSQIIMAIVTINAWNRIAVSTQMELEN